MSGFASKSDEDTPQTLWEDQQNLGARMMLTIPFGATYEEMQGFVSVLGESGDEAAPFPVITFCVAKPSGGAIVSTIVFSSAGRYTDFVERIYVDCYSKFSNKMLETS
tara:strand:+ start:24 stop:347 length:324 start_codon:yes stop_codon:yes gene_type:complete